MWSFHARIFPYIWSNLSILSLFFLTKFTPFFTTKRYWVSECFFSIHLVIKYVIITTIKLSFAIFYSTSFPNRTRISCISVHDPSDVWRATIYLIPISFFNSTLSFFSKLIFAFLSEYFDCCLLNEIYSTSSFLEETIYALSSFLLENSEEKKPLLSFFFFGGGVDFKAGPDPPPAHPDYLEYFFWNSWAFSVKFIDLQLRSSKFAEMSIAVFLESDISLIIWSIGSIGSICSNLYSWGFGF